MDLKQPLPPHLFIMLQSPKYLYKQDAYDIVKLVLLANDLPNLLDFFGVTCASDNLCL